MSRVFVGGDTAAAATAFVDAGYEPDDLVLLEGDASEALKAADARGEKYVLVHVGADDGAPEGSYARAHHRVGVEELPDLAKRIKPRDRLLLRLLSFGYKYGLPPAADWVVDARFLDNPYWVEELRPGTGLDPAVRRYVLAQPAAGELLDNLVRTIGSLIPAYRAQGRQELVVAFGCTGGRHRSVTLTAELAERLQGAEDVEIAVEHREL